MGVGVTSDDLLLYRTPAISCGLRAGPLTSSRMDVLGKNPGKSCTIAWSSRRMQSGFPCLVVTVAICTGVSELQVSQSSFSSVRRSSFSSPPVVSGSSLTLATISSSEPCLWRRTVVRIFLEKIFPMAAPRGSSDYAPLGEESSAMSATPACSQAPDLISCCICCVVSTVMT